MALKSAAGCTRHTIIRHNSCYKYIGKSSRYICSMNCVSRHITAGHTDLSQTGSRLSSLRDTKQKQVQTPQSQFFLCPVQQLRYEFQYHALHPLLRSPTLRPCSGPFFSPEKQKYMTAEIALASLHLLRPYATRSHMHTAPSPRPRSSRSHALRYFGFLSV
jgi:hypothetical protein